MKIFNNGEMIANKVNKFVEHNTHDLIKDIIEGQDISSDIAMILVNTIYFKASWENKFDAHDTKKELFNNRSQVDMMTITANFKYYEDKNFQILEMPYEGDQFCMVFILPRDLSNPTNNFNNCNGYILDYDMIEVHIPKFTQRNKINVIPYLQKLGVNDLFSADLARLTNMCASSSVYVSKMIHEAVIIVNETGTEATAITMVEFNDECCMEGPEPSKVFYANRPFMYCIKDKLTDTTLFGGWYHGRQN